MDGFLAEWSAQPGSDLRILVLCTANSDNDRMSMDNGIGIFPGFRYNDQER